MPVLKGLRNELGPPGLVVLKVFVGEDAQTVKRFNGGFGLSFPLLPDADGRVASRYRISRHPHTVIIDRSGLIVGRVEGERNWAHPVAREWIARLLAGSPPRLPPDPRP